MKNRKYPLLITLVLLSGGLLAYTVARATLLSMTHDESTTFWLRNMDLLSCFFSEKCWGNANNHLLNTWLMKRSMGIFGVSELSIRAPNLLAHLLYLYASARIILYFERHMVVGIAGFMLINFNPYLLDFFSLARGYGLSIGFIMASLAVLFHFLRHDRLRSLVLSYGLVFLAIMANFVALNYLVSLWGTIFLLGFLQTSEGSVKISFRWRYQIETNIIPLAMTVVLVVLLYIPIRSLQGGGEFNFGAPHFQDTFRSLVSHSLYGVNYFSKNTAVIFGFVYAVAMLSSLAGAFWFFFRKPEEHWRRCYLATALLFLLSCLVMILQHYVLGSNYLVDRKLLIFILYSGLLFYFLLYGAADLLGKRFGGIAGAILSLIIVYHASRTVNFEYCREWWYDRDTKEMVRYLEKLPLPADGVIDLGVNWVFQPSTSFYLYCMNMADFFTLPLDSNIRTDGRYDYYYVFSSDFPQLQDQYEIEKQFPAGAYLLRKKGLD
jgi:hypothetical protein